MHRKRAIDRVLAGDASPRAEERVRAHLRGCAACRRYFDDEVRLLRALAGDLGQAAPLEEARSLARALAGAGLAPPAPPRAAWLGVRARLALAGALALALVLAGAALWSRHGRPIVAERPRAAAPSPPPEPTLPSGRLTMVKASTVDGAPALAGSTLVAGARLRVGARGLAEVELARGGRVRVFPSTEVRFSPRGELVELASGKVWCEVDKHRGSFSVRTDGAEARVLGTSFVVERGADGHTDVRVSRGTVEVEDRDRHGKVRVSGGERTHVAAHSAPSPARRYDSDADWKDWQRFFDDLGRAIERGVKDIGDAFKH